jgi:hypothetical protein
MTSKPPPSGTQQARKIPEKSQKHFRTADNCFWDFSGIFWDAFKAT